MTLTVHADMDQYSEAWVAARCGMITASEVALLVTGATYKAASNEKERQHLYELLAQRITRYVEPHYVGFDQQRGYDDESRARLKYEEVTGVPVKLCGFITNDKWGFSIGYSPDGLVGPVGLIECKSRRQKYQVQTIIENVGIDKGTTIPGDYVLQAQTGLMVSERKWLDLVSYSGGLPMAILRVFPDATVQNAIVEAAGAFEKRLAEKMEIYRSASEGLAPTERFIEPEMYNSGQ